MFQASDSLPPNGKFVSLVGRASSRAGSSVASLHLAMKLLHHISVGIEEFDLAPAKFADGCFDFGAVTDDHPDQLVRMHRFLSGFRYVVYGERANLAGIGGEIIFRQTERHDFIERSAHRADGF